MGKEGPFQVKVSPFHGGPGFIRTGVLMQRGNWERDANTESVPGEPEDGPLETKERGLRGDQLSHFPGLRLPASRTERQWLLWCEPRVCGALL